MLVFRDSRLIVIRDMLGVFRVTPWEYSKNRFFRFLIMEYSVTLNTPLPNRPGLYGFFQ